MSSHIEKQVGVPTEFDAIYIIFYFCNAESVPAYYNTSFKFGIPIEFDLADCKSSCLFTTESSSINSSLTMHVVEENKVANVYTKVTCIKPFLLNMILILSFLGNRIIDSQLYRPHIFVLAVTSFSYIVLVLMSLMSDSTLLAHCVSPHLRSHHHLALCHFVIAT